MKRFTQALIAIFGFVVVGSVVSLVPQKNAGAAGAAGQGAAPVNVVNTPTVNAQQSGTWNVGITGTPNVNIANTPTVNLGAASSVGINGSVTIGNTASSPVLERDLDNPARHRFQINGNCITSAVEPSGCDIPFTVPSGKLLVIESVSVEAATPIGLQARASIRVVQDGAGIPYFFPLQLQGTFPAHDEFHGMEPVRLYADPGSTVTVAVEFSSSSIGNASGYGAISGYLVDCGSGSGCPMP
jgi:hypothetical protein